MSRLQTLRWTLLVVLLIAGTGGSWLLSEAFRADANRAWTAQADRAAHGLSGVVLNWLEESYAPISGLAALAENTGVLSEAEFLNAYEGLEARATAFFLDGAAYLRQGANSEWQPTYTTNPYGLLGPGVRIAATPWIQTPVDGAVARFGELMLGPPHAVDGNVLALVALAVRDSVGDAVVVGLVDYTNLIKGLYQLHVPPGMHLRLDGKFLNGDLQQVWSDDFSAALHVVTERTASAGADLSVSWVISKAFSGGPSVKLARVTLIAGVSGSIILALFIAMLLWRNETISKRVKEATSELASNAEKLREARDAADAANKAKSEFLANMSHELRTPMNAILGYSEMLMEEAEDIGQEDFIPDLKKINQAGNHLLALINDVLDLSKIESGKMEAFAETIELDVLIDEVSNTVQPLMEKNNNRFTIERSEHLGHAKQDLTKLRQTLFNLLSNAAKFTHEGIVSLRVDRKQQAGEGWLTFEVSDTGIGIAEDKIEQVFQEFTQADGSTTRDYGGTGLGLSISRRFCELLGGNLNVRSQPGKGSTFTIRIPVNLPGTKPQPVPAETATKKVVSAGRVIKGQSGATILVIDDDQEACEIIKRNLTKDGFSVVTASSGEQGLRLARELQPAAITLDVLMPNMDGWSVLRALKADPVLHKIPVIMLSMIDDRTRGYSLGAVDYLTKPVDREQLHKALSRYYVADDNGTVLLVDDNMQNREVMALTLKKAGWQVAEAGNGREAFESMESATRTDSA